MIVMKIMNFTSRISGTKIKIDKRNRRAAGTRRRMRAARTNFYQEMTAHTFFDQNKDKGGNKIERLEFYIDLCKDERFQDNYNTKKIKVNKKENKRS